MNSLRITSSSEIRSVILNAQKIFQSHKCEQCDGSGYQNWNGETGDDVKAGKLASYDNERTDGYCEYCEG